MAVNRNAEDIASALRAQRLEHRRHRAGLKTPSHVLEAIGDGDLLRTVTGAGPASDTVAHELRFGRPDGTRREILLEPREPSMGIARVIRAEATGDVDAARARHAVSAPGAGNAVALLEFSDHAGDDIQLAR